MIHFGDGLTLSTAVIRHIPDMLAFNSLKGRGLKGSHRANLIFEILTARHRGMSETLAFQMTYSLSSTVCTAHDIICPHQDRIFHLTQLNRK